MKKTIRVTQELIDNGQKIDAACCPVALALKKEVDPKASCGDTSCYLGKRYGRHELPQAVITFVKAFDKGLPVEPFEFEIDLPD
jgi:hypothetical protein